MQINQQFQKSKCTLHNNSVQYRFYLKITLSRCTDVQIARTTIQMKKICYSTYDSSTVIGFM